MIAVITIVSMAALVLGLLMLAHANNDYKSITVIQHGNDKIQHLKMGFGKCFVVVNGERYEAQGSSLTVVDGEVLIDGRKVKPK